MEHVVFKFEIRTWQCIVEYFEHEQPGFRVERSRHARIVARRLRRDFDPQNTQLLRKVLQLRPYLSRPFPTSLSRQHYLRTRDGSQL